ncbi:MAG: formylglycine-generating enzyme family protein [Candidatus Eisenbacteria bacterium]|uniref:Formylglycine-generating enzyme family protein n=1 Tax=Eiseniibacteriota bacterium TaxID=2212470 RepID=A0A948RZ38_UNCEI|nr:formylglycine-generating enzyme family protein [Candidatus Eisenbacteria bacterium]MBU1949658.1 formylglycine-generating enzyme family protein [Candidatus Eisenbacteria bacterium]MBU2693051.1 formylglycine-generating enzyme family protein [Candidatus Eisenbacteria bacterium]
MKRRICVILGLGLALSAAAGHGEWKMQIHSGATVDEYNVADIDSMTFTDSDIPIPGMVLVPAGVFIMGDGVSYCGIDQLQVTLTHDFLMDQTEVTNQEYMEALQWAYNNGYVTTTASAVLDNLDGSSVELLDLDQAACEIQFSAGTFYLRESPSSEAQNAYPGGYDPSVHPVIMVTWYGAARYCDWLSLQAGYPRAYEHSGNWTCNGGYPYGAQGFRLPTNAEQEYAEQYDDERIYPWGNEAPDCTRANYRTGSQSFCVGWTAPVGNYPAAPASLEIFDLAGNVLEWCNDWFVCDLGTTPLINPPGPTSGDGRVLRGGSWNTMSGSLACALRQYGLPTYQIFQAGFRTVKTVTP